jgi:hypothetical protein
MAKKKASRAKGKTGPRGMPPKTNNLVSAVDAQNRKRALERAVAKRSVLTRR